MRRWGDGAAEIAMNEIESPGSPMLGLLREWCPPLFPGQARVALLMDMIQLWQPAHQVAAA